MGSFVDGWGPLFLSTLSSPVDNLHAALAVSSREDSRKVVDRNAVAKFHRRLAVIEVACFARRPSSYLLNRNKHTHSDFSSSDQPSRRASEESVSFEINRLQIAQCLAYVLEVPSLTDLPMKDPIESRSDADRWPPVLDSAVKRKGGEGEGRVGFRVSAGLPQ